MEETAGCPEWQRLQARVAELEGMVRDLAVQVKDLMAKLPGTPPPSRASAAIPSAPARSRLAASKAVNPATHRTSSNVCRPNFPLAERFVFSLAVMAQMQKQKRR